jgi:hypothetical protein
MSEPDDLGAPPRHFGTLRVIAWTLLLGLAFLLPFEAPLFRLGPLLITSSELMLYLLIGAWATSALATGAASFVGAAGRARTAVRNLSRDPVGRAVTLWLVVTVLSAAMSPSQWAPAAKFALRTLSGGLLYFATRDLARGPLRPRIVAIAVVGGAVLSALFALVESLYPAATWWWRPFRPQAFFALDGLARASATFAFPTIASMFWEASIPLVFLVVLGGPKSRQRTSWRQMAFAIILAAILVQAILTSVTRASLAGVVVTVGILFALGKYLEPSRRRAVRVFAAGVMTVEALLVMAALVHSGPDSTLARRLLWWREGVPSKARDTFASTTPTEGKPLPEVPQLDTGLVAAPLPSRSELWTAAVRLWRRSPVLGIGPDNFRHRYPEVIHPPHGGRFNDERMHANNLYFETLADLGLAGVVALALLAYGIWRATRSCLILGVGVPGLIASVAVATFFIHGFVDYFLEFTPTFGLWWLLVGLTGQGANGVAVDGKNHSGTAGAAGTSVPVRAMTRTPG